MKKLLLLLLLTSCMPINKLAVEPLIVTEKIYFLDDGGVAEYRMTDAEGKMFVRHYGDRFWNVGDTVIIKK